MYKFEFEKNKCWYKDSCNKYDTADCFAGCIRYAEIHYLMNSAKIPEAKQYPTILVPDKVDIQKFYKLQEIKNNISTFIKNGENIYIWGACTGNGKTTWGLKFLQKFFDDVWSGNGFRTRGLFIHVPTFLTKNKEVISRKDIEFEIFKQLIPEVDEVLWDDIAATGIKDFDHACLLSYIEQRKLQEKSNIFTGNLDEKGLINSVGKRLTSRIWNDSVRIELLGRDRREGKNDCITSIK